MSAHQRIPCAGVLLPLIALILVGVNANANPFEDSMGVRIALRVYDECSKQEFSPCLKKKAITFLDRLSRMEKFTIVEGVTVIRAQDTPAEPTIIEDQIEQNLPRTLDRDSALTNMLLEKLTTFVGSRTIQTTLPKLSVTDLGLVEEGRGKKKGGGGLKGMMGHMMMGMAGKMMALIPMGIAGLFLLAGKALITAKIALLLSGIIAIKKLIASKQGGGGAVHVAAGGGGWQSGGGGGGGGWQSGGGGWDKRSLDGNKLAYKSYMPK